jgi:hypothetical protein
MPGSLKILLELFFDSERQASIKLACCSQQLLKREA